MTALIEIVLKTVLGGALVLAFAVIAETLSPKRFAGILAAAPSVALASLLMTVTFKGPMDARRACAGMVAGAVGFVAYCALAPSALRRFGVLRGALLALIAWAVVSAAVFPGSASLPAARAASAIPAASRRAEPRRPALRCDPGKIREATPKDAAVRFAFGAGTSAVAGLVTLASPVVGGVFLAFPAILLASLTLIADEEGQTAARDDARGAAAGAVGLAAFAATGSALFHRWPTPTAFVCATVAWLLASGACYGAAWAVGAGADERN
jgi:uncharacterized membrane protein (GlpM family)